MTINDIEEVQVFAVIDKKGHRLLLSNAQNNAIYEYLKIITQNDKSLKASKEIYFEVNKK